MLEQQANERWEMSSSIDASAMVSRELASVQRAADGDHQAQAWLVHRVLATVRRAARSLADSASDADDAAQIALIEVLQSARTYRGLAPLEAWAGRIATRVATRHLARERRHRRRVIATDADPPSRSDPADELAEHLPRAMRSYLARLPHEQRTTLLLRHALGYSLDEIAERTHVSRNTVKGRLRLGAATLRKWIRRDTNLARRRSPRH